MTNVNSMLSTFRRVPRPCVGRPSNGCATSEDLFWKLEALQSFIRDLHWPDPEFGQHLNQRLKLMACDMIESSIQRTYASFENKLKSGINLNPTDYILPNEICAMINVVLDAKNQSLKLCSADGLDMEKTVVKNGKKHKYHTKIDEQIEKISGQMSKDVVGKLVQVMEKTLSKLATFDEGSMMGSMLGFVNKKINVTGSGTDLGKSYILFIRSNLDTLSKRITDDCWILIVTERWYHGQMGMLATWLTNRMDKALHPYQCTCLSHIVKKMYNEYELHGMTDEKIRTAHFNQVEQRMATEEATCQLQNAEHSENK